MKTIVLLVFAGLFFTFIPTAAQIAPNFPEMLAIPAGTFQMGSRAGDADEKPLHSVTLSGFFLAKTETTFAQFQTFVDHTGYRTDAERGDGSFIWDSLGWHKQEGVNWRHDERGRLRSKSTSNIAAYPVFHVSWYDAAHYCNWLSEQFSLTQVYDFQKDSVKINFSAQGYRLPTEAEWEYAAGGGNLLPTPFSGTGILQTLAWYSGNAHHHAHPVALQRPNALGLYDLTGNVWEWCQDWYDPVVYEKSSANAPFGPDKGQLRSLRGGSWNNNHAHCRIANRSSRYPDFRDGSVGFRVARR